jgi:ABC-type sugar transport system ATPase subunit
MRDGKVVTTQETKDLTSEKLVQYMVGREMKERFRSMTPEERQEYLKR